MVRSASSQYSKGKEESYQLQCRSLQCNGYSGFERQRVHLWTSPRLIAVGELQHYDNDVHIPRYQVNKVAKENICLGTVLFSSPFVSKAKRKESNAFHLLLLFFLKCGACFSLIYFCARTPIIPKEEKHSDFPLISAAIILILSLTCSKEVVESQNLNEIMQSEAKGVLIYFLMFLKFCKCSSMPSEIMKNLLESTLLILTGAEMFREFWKKECSGLLHFLIKIIPLNTLLVILCWLTDNKYGSYDLIPALMITFPLFYLPLLLPFHKAKDSPKRRLIHHCLKTSAVFFLMLSTIYYWEIDFLSLNIISNFFLNKDGFPDTAIEQWKRNKYRLLAISRYDIFYSI
ncbi:CAS1 domain-containing protein 1 [Armadillidium vulgare]|nr:CAS1 domain-containing protein 1 [Armadillidium vulgare]